MMIHAFYLTLLRTFEDFCLLVVLFVNYHFLNSFKFKDMFSKLNVCHFATIKFLNSNIIFQIILQSLLYILCLLRLKVFNLGLGADMAKVVKVKISKKSSPQRNINPIVCHLKKEVLKNI